MKRKDRKEKWKERIERRDEKKGLKGEMKRKDRKEKWETQKGKYFNFR